MLYRSIQNSHIIPPLTRGFWYSSLLGGGAGIWQTAKFPGRDIDQNTTGVGNFIWCLGVMFPTALCMKVARVCLQTTYILYTKLFRIFKLSFYTCDEKRRQFASVLMWKQQDRGKKRTKLDMVIAENVPFRYFKVLAQFKLPTFFGTAPTVQNYPFVRVMLLALLSNSRVH